MDYMGKPVGIMLPISGIMSEVWVKRQAESFLHLSPRLISWEKHNPSAWTLNDSDSLLNIPWNPKRSVISRLLNKLGFDEAFNRNLVNKPLSQLFSRSMPCAFVCHFGWTAAKAYKFFQSNKVPYFIVFHGSDLAVPSLKGTYRRELRAAIKNATGCIIVGSHMKPILREIYPELEDQKIHRIPCGAPMDQFCIHPQKNRLKDEPLKLITVGRLVNGKGIDLCIKALEVISSRGNIQLSIIGDGEETSRLVEMTNRLGLEGSVKFLGHQSPEEIANQLSNHHVFLQPSRKAKHGWVEGFGVSITEAMASALPVIATNTGGIPDQVRDGKDGFLVDIDDYESIANCILEYDRDENLRVSHGLSAREQAKSFDAKIMSHKLEDLILESLI